MSGDDTKSKYQISKRTRKRITPAGKKVSKAVVYVCRETLQEIRISVDEIKQTGIITFLTKSGKEIRRVLVFTWYPQGIWTVKIEKNKKAPHIYSNTILKAENVDKVILDRIVKMSKGKKWYSYLYKFESKFQTDRPVDCLMASVLNKEIKIKVNYQQFPAGEEGGKISLIPLSDDYFKMLSNQYVAYVFLLMLEHFAGIQIDERLAIGGISKKEYDKLVKLKSKDPNLTVQTIARVVARAANEFTVTFGKTAEKEFTCFILMTEAILYQRKRKNQFALANQLEIANGYLRLPDGRLISQSGIKLRGESTLLLYDKYGNAISAFIGYMDINYRSVDLEKVPVIQIKVGESLAAQFLKVLEQTFAYPNREMYIFLADVGDFYKYLPEEILRLYGGEIKKKFMAMLPYALGFFVVMAVIMGTAGYMAKKGNPYAMAVIVMAKAMGWIMNVDFALGRIAPQLAIAGRHYGMMEKINRRSPKEKGKIVLTKLSLHHLKVGTKALIEAMAEIAVFGIFVAGGKLGEVAGVKMAKYIRKIRSEARIEIHIKNDVVTEVKSIRGQKQIDVETRPLNSSISTSKFSKVGNKPKRVYNDVPPAEESGWTLGKRERPVSRFRRVVKALEWKNYKTTDPKGRAATSPEVTGMPKEHLNIAIKCAREQDVIALFRITNYRGVQHALNGHPPKPKNLIAMNTDSVTGKVTALNYKQRKIAMEAGNYILTADGYAYNRLLPQKILLGANGKPLRFDMQAKGQYGELTNRPGQVIEPKSGKAYVGDYDLQDVIPIHSQGSNIAGVPSKVTGDVQSPHVTTFIRLFNHALNAMKRIVHGADAQFMQYKTFRTQAFKGDAIGILPDGRVVYFTNKDLIRFYKDIGRSRLTLPEGTKLQPYKKN